MWAVVATFDTTDPMLFGPYDDEPQAKAGVEQVRRFLAEKQMLSHLQDISHERMKARP